MLSPYLITGSEHNGDVLPKNYKGCTLEYSNSFNTQHRCEPHKPKSLL
jgi:hypothetical protein